MGAIRYNFLPLDLQIPSKYQNVEGKRDWAENVEGESIYELQIS